MNKAELIMALSGVSDDTQIRVYTVEGRTSFYRIDGVEISEDWDDGRRLEVDLNCVEL